MLPMPLLIAFDAIDVARNAMEAGRYTTHHVAEVREAHAVLGKFLSDKRARCLDHYERDELLRYVWIAGDQLDMVAAYSAPDRKEDRIKVGDGRWVVTRIINIGGSDYLNERACYNPAVGSAALDEWETYLRASLPKLKAAA